MFPTKVFSLALLCLSFFFFSTYLQPINPPTLSCPQIFEDKHQQYSLLPSYSFLAYYQPSTILAEYPSCLHLQDS